MLRTRIQAEVYRGGSHQHSLLLFPAVRKIYQREGLKTLYNGFSSSVIGLSHPLVQFVAYENLKLWFAARNHGRPPNTLEIFVSATVSKCTDTALTAG